MKLPRRVRMIYADSVGPDLPHIRVICYPMILPYTYRIYWVWGVHSFLDPKPGVDDGA